MWRTIPYPGCGQIFTSRASYKLHFNSCIKGVHFNCPTCDHTFPRKSTCDEHIDLHLSGQHFHCIICKTKYQTIGSLRNHACNKHRTTLAKLEQNIYVEPREKIFGQN